MRVCHYLPARTHLSLAARLPLCCLVHAHPATPRHTPNSTPSTKHTHITLITHPQYHPEASPGPHDADVCFEQFVEMMKAEALVKAA